MLKRLILSTIFLLGVAAQGVIVGATDIGAELCDGVSGPVITLTAPLSDSIVNTSNVMLQGTAERTTQIDISLNGSYSSSLAVGSSERIDTTVALAKGTNTIRLDAYYSCNQTTSATTVVVTYEPAASPSDGSTTPTVLPPTAERPAHSQAPQPATAPSEHPPVDGNPQPVSENPVPGDGNQPSTEPEDTYGWVPTTLVPAGLVATTLVTPSIALLALEKLSGIVGMAGLHLPELLRWSIRGSGLLLAGLLAALLHGAV